MRNYYVYCLVDPRDASVFYIGKGKGKRIAQHVMAARRGRVDNAPKHKRITEIHSAGFEVIERITHQNLTELQAFKIEGELINTGKAFLTNIQGGVVTNEDRLKERALYVLRHLISFDEWISRGTIKQLETAKKLTGDHYLTYQIIKGGIERIAHAS